MNAAEQPKAASTQDRVIRVFISSTFRDMMRERDLLVKEVFPELRRKCAKRFVTFTEVDLRWGITEAQANEGQVLPLCLAEIERSRPYFIGLLGERYGWIPDTIRPEVIAREPWLKEHVQGRTSVTELEILHGVLNNPQMQSHAFFYFRDPSYLNDPALTDDERRDIVERDIRSDVDKYGEVEAIRRTAERKAKLAALKQRIRDSKLPLVEPYANPKALAEVVRKHFDELIDRLYPEDKVPDPLAQERMAHDAHAKNKLFACIDRPAHLAALNAFAARTEHDGKGLVVTGESGGGKTALLAAWDRDWAKNHPKDFLFQHYFGATPDSASLEGFLHRLLGELKSRFSIPDNIPADPEKLRDALPVWLAQASARVSSLAPTGGEGATYKEPSRIVLVLDGLNQVQGSELDRRLCFLPRRFPSHVVALTSSLPGPALDALLERGWVVHDLPRARKAEVDEMVGEYLRIHARTLEPELRQQLVTAPGAKNPLFLRTVLDELRQFGSFEKLSKRLAYYLRARKPRELFLRVIIRWQEDFDGKDSEQDKPKLELVRRALTHLWAARQGLSEPEWLDLLGMPPSVPTSDLRPLTSDPFPRALWTPFFFALEPHLSQRVGLFAFGHDFLRLAVGATFVTSGALQQTAHRSIADYFDHHVHQREMTPRKAAEWPHQLHAAHAWDRLQACLTDIPLFLALCNDETKWELTGYWHLLRRQGRDIGGCYSIAYARWITVPANSADDYVSTQLGGFLLENGQYSAAEPLLKQALEARKRILGPEHPGTLTSLNNLAGLLERKGDKAGAEPLSRVALDTCERVLGPEHPDTLTSINNLAVLLQRNGAYAGAEPLFRRALEVRERVLGPEHAETLTSLNNLAGLLERKGDCAGAEPLFRRALEVRERVLGRDHPDTLVSVSGLAGLLYHRGNNAGAEPLFRRALEVRERILGSEHPNTLTSASSLAELLSSKGDNATAEPLSQGALDTCERVLGPEHPDTLTSINNLAVLLQRNGDYAGAEPLFRRAMEVRERILGPDHPDTLVSVSGLAGLLYQKGDCAGAEPLFRRALEVRERVLGPDHPDTLVSVSGLAGLLYHKGDCGNRVSFVRWALKVRGWVFGPEHPSTLTSVNNLAVLLDRIGDYGGAEPLFRRALEVRERVLGRDHPDTLVSLSGLAGLLYHKGDNAGAEPLFRRVLVVRGWVFGAEHPRTLTSMNSLTKLLGRKGDCGNTVSFVRWGVKVRGWVLGPEHPSTLTRVNNLAVLLEKNGDYGSAEPLFRRAMEVRERVLGPEHSDTLLSVSGLAGLLYHKGDNAGAEPLFRRALEVRERVLGPEHPDTLVSASGLAKLLYHKGDKMGADRLYRRLLEARDRVFPPEHPNTLASVNSLARLQDSRSDKAGAEPLSRGIIEACERVLGPEHPDTLASVNNLAVLLESKGDYAGAEPLFRRVLEARERFLGPEHPNTLTSVNSLARLLFHRRAYAGAVWLCQLVIERQLKISAMTGYHHPNLQLSIANYASCLEKQGRSREEIRNKLEAMMRPFGFSLDDGGQVRP